MVYLLVAVTKVDKAEHNQKLIAISGVFILQADLGTRKLLTT